MAFDESKVHLRNIHRESIEHLSIEYRKSFDNWIKTSMKIKMILKVSKNLSELNSWHLTNRKSIWGTSIENRLNICLSNIFRQLNQNQHEKQNDIKSNLIHCNLTFWGSQDILSSSIETFVFEPRSVNRMIRIWFWGSRVLVAKDSPVPHEHHTLSQFCSSEHGFSRVANSASPIQQSSGAMASSKQPPIPGVRRQLQRGLAICDSAFHPS